LEGRRLPLSLVKKKVKSLQRKKGESWKGHEQGEMGGDLQRGHNVQMVWEDLEVARLNRTAAGKKRGNSVGMADREGQGKPERVEDLKGRPV